MHNAIPHGPVGTSSLTTQSPSDVPTHSPPQSPSQENIPPRTAFPPPQQRYPTQPLSDAPPNQDPRHLPQRRSNLAGRYHSPPKAHHKNLLPSSSQYPTTNYPIFGISAKFARYRPMVEQLRGRSLLQQFTTCAEYSLTSPTKSTYHDAVRICPVFRSHSGPRFDGNSIRSFAETSFQIAATSGSRDR